MFLDNKILDKVADLICGDKLAAELCDDDDSDCPCYRKGRDLPKFLMMLDLIVLHLEMILVNGGH